MKPSNFKNLLVCRLAVLDLFREIADHHGSAVALSLFAKLLPSRQKLRNATNDRLMFEYIKSVLSVKRFAAQAAEKNKTLSREDRLGPSGTTSAGTLEKQITRLKKSLRAIPTVTA